MEPYGSPSHECFNCSRDVFLFKVAPNNKYIVFFAMSYIIVRNPYL